jgi:UDP-glucose 4-epimerase
MATVLVTGAHGFIGRYTCRAAADAGHSVVGIGHGEWTPESWRRWGLTAWYELDVSIGSLIAHDIRPHVIVHCAGSGSVAFSNDNPAQDFQRSVVTTLEVLEYIRTCSPRTRIVFPSSAAVYGAGATRSMEDRGGLTPLSPYGAHKLMGEDLCRSYSRTFGLKTAIVRVFSAYGEGLRKQLLWDACEKVRYGSTQFGGTGHERRDWVHVSDVAALLLLASTFASPRAPTVDGATGAGVSTSSVLGALFHALGSDKQPEFSGVSRLGDPVDLCGDPGAALTWGWGARVDWKTGVEDYAQWYRKQVP